jgi:cytochrome c
MHNMTAWILRAFAVCALLAGHLDAALAEGDAVRGSQLFRRCSACHSAEGQPGIGPALNGVFGRQAGTLEGYRYSRAMADSNVIWTHETLDAYLTRPAGMIRGTSMALNVSRPGDRSDIIAYLRTLAAR